MPVAGGRFYGSFIHLTDTAVIGLSYNHSVITSSQLWKSYSNGKLVPIVVADHISPNTPFQPKPGTGGLLGVSHSRLNKNPLPNAAKPVSLVAPMFGDIQCNVPVSFSFPPAIPSPPRYVIIVIHSLLVGM